MNDVQKFILNRAMQKVASKGMQKEANEGQLVPFAYSKQRRNAYLNQGEVDRISVYDTPGAAYSEPLKEVIPFFDLDNHRVSTLPKLREQQAHYQAQQLGLRVGTNAYNQMVKYLIEQGETNWYNFNNPKNPKLNIKVPHFEHDNGVDIKELNNDQERVRKAGRTMVSTDNYKKFSGNA
jgi:hypothetical protein